jgi:hypothetical protein
MGLPLKNKLILIRSAVRVSQTERAQISFERGIVGVIVTSGSVTVTPWHGDERGSKTQPLLNAAIRA